MRGTDGHRYPSYDDENKQEAARFLGSEFDTYEPTIRGIDDLDRLNAWTEVAKALDCSEARRTLRLRRQALTDAETDVDFVRASETTDAVADGGAVVKESTADVQSDDERELSPDQEWAEYTDDAELESEKNSMRGFSESYGTVEAVEEALEDEFDGDVVRRHVVELLDERREVLGGERDE